MPVLAQSSTEVAVSPSLQLGGLGEGSVLVGLAGKALMRRGLTSEYLQGVGKESDSAGQGEPNAVEGLGPPSVLISKAGFLLECSRGDGEVGEGLISTSEEHLVLWLAQSSLEINKAPEGILGSLPASTQLGWAWVRHQRRSFCRLSRFLLIRRRLLCACRRGNSLGLEQVWMRGVVQGQLGWRK